MRANPDDILGMAFFARVVEARSFSDAARSLGVSKSAVSARVSRLEERLGVRLLHRTTRRLALTADGVRLYERAAKVAAAADEAAELAAGASSAPRGVLRIFAPAAFARAWLVRPIDVFMTTYPDVRVELRLGDRLADVSGDGIDVYIVLAQQLADSSLVAKKLATTRVVTCAAPNYLRRRGIPFRPQDLIHHRCLAHPSVTSDGWCFNTEEGVVSIAPGARIVADEIGLLHAATLEGLGIAMLPQPIVAEDLESGRVHRVLDDFQSIELGVFALHAHARHTPASVRAFVDHLALAFQRPPWERSARTPGVRPRRSERASATFPMTEQDGRRLEAVAALHAPIDAEGAARLRHVLSRAKPTLSSKVPRNVVTMNSRVVCRDERNGERELSVVYPWDAGDGRVSVLSAEGAALLGASVGGAVEHGGRTMTIVSIPYQPESAGDHHL